MQLEEKFILNTLKDTRKALGLSGDEVARKIGKADNTYVSRIENGKVKLSIKLINQLCEIYQLNPLSLFQGEETYDLVQQNTTSTGFLENLSFRSESRSICETAKSNIKYQLPVLRKIGKVMRRFKDSPVKLNDFFHAHAAMLKPSTYDNAKKIGKNAAIALREYLKLGLDPIADIQDLAWRTLKIPVCGVDLGNSCWGLYNKDSKGTPLIVYSSAHDATQRNIFTIAHEIGHHFFSPDEASIDLDSNCNISDDNYKEVLANSFAQEFLVPADALYKFMSDEGLFLVELNQKHIVNMCQHFKVSYYMMLFVLNDNNMIKKDIFKKLKSYNLQNIQSIGYSPHKYMAEPLKLETILETMIARGVRTNKISTLFASEILNITEQEVQEII